MRVILTAHERAEPYVGRGDIGPRTAQVVAPALTRTLLPSDYFRRCLVYLFLISARPCHVPPKPPCDGLQYSSAISCATSTMRRGGCALPPYEDGDPHTGEAHRPKPKRFPAPSGHPPHADQFRNAAEVRAYDWRTCRERSNFAWVYSPPIAPASQEHDSLSATRNFSIGNRRKERDPRVLHVRI
jgi:hypothetical protein